MLLIYGAVDAEAYAAPMRAEGFEVDHKMTAHAALASLGQRGACAVVIDQALPDADGLRLCASIRRLCRTGVVPIIFLSRAPLPDIQPAAERLGVTEALQYPVEPERLVQTLECHCPV